MEAGKPIAYSGQGFSLLGEKGRFVLPPDFRKAVRDSGLGERVLCVAKHPRWNRPYTELIYQPMVEELRYLRDFKGADIAQRSIDEMQGQRALTPAQLKSWSATLQALIPNVRSGESITGVYQPDKGMQLLHQDRLLGELSDTELAQRFLGIWLAPETSQRQLRQQLLARAQL